MPVDNFLSDLKQRIRTAQLRAALAVNQEVITLYWQIGKLILEREKQEGWDDKAISKLSQDLTRRFPNVDSFSPRNLKYMKRMAAAYSDEKLVQQAFNLLPWQHNQFLLDKLGSRDERVWYALKAFEYGWSHNILAIHIERNRIAREKQIDFDFNQTLPPEGSDLSRLLIENQHSVNLIELQEIAKEDNLKQALVNHIGHFLLNLRVGFALVGSQYRFDVGGDEFFADLIYYHVRLRRYVVIAIETTKFDPGFVGKMNFLVNVVNDRLAGERDEPTVGMILCKSKSKTVAEYTLGSLKSSIGVAAYAQAKGLPPHLDNGLPTAQQLEEQLAIASQEFES